MYILNYVLSALFLLAFSLKDLHPILAHHHSSQQIEYSNQEIKVNIQNDELEQECFICDLFFSVKAITSKSLPVAKLHEVLAPTYTPELNKPVSVFLTQLPARAPPAVIEY